MSWSDLAAMVDDSVDATWGECFRLMPWRPGELDDGEPDTSRKITEQVGVLMLAGEKVQGLVGDVRASGVQFQTRIETGDATLSVAGANLADEVCEGDRIQMLDSKRAGTIDEFFSVVRVLSDVAGRYTLGLVRLPRA